MDSWLAGLKGTLNLWDAHRVKVYNKEFRAEHPEYFDPDGIMVFCGPQGNPKMKEMLDQMKKIADTMKQLTGQASGSGVTTVTGNGGEGEA